MAISFIAGSAQFLAPTSTTIPTPGGLNIAAGDTIVVAIKTSSTVSYVTGVTDTAGNVYRFAGHVFTGIASSMEVWYVTNAVANATNIITATYNITITNRAIAAAQFREIGTISPLDATARENVATANITSSAFSTAVANAVLVACSVINSTTSTWTVGTGYTEAIRSTENAIFIQYKIVSALQSGVTATANNNTAVAKSIFVISLHESIAGGGGEHSAVF